MVIRRHLLVFLHAWIVACAQADSSAPLWTEAERACRNCVDVASLPGLHGSVHARYLIVSAIYGAPGSKQCRDKGVVEYGSASRLGATTSLRGTFREDVSVRAVVPKHALSFSMIGEYSVPDADPSALSIAKNRGIGLGFPGPCEDGIKRDWGHFLVWMEPTIQLAIQDDEIVWSVDTSKIEARLLGAGDLEPYTSIDMTLPESLRKHGLQSHDVSQILMANPLLGDEPGPLEPPRFLPFKRVEYRADKQGPNDRDVELTQPPIPKDADLPLATFDYAVHFEIEGSDAFQDKLRSMMVDANRWRWTLSNAGAGWAGSGEIVQLHMGSASADYEGPPIVASYYDTLFQSFAFATEERE